MATVMTLCPDCRCMTAQREDPSAKAPRHERGQRCGWCAGKQAAKDANTQACIERRTR
jgi:hypothetical protein